MTAEPTPPPTCLILLRLSGDLSTKAVGTRDRFVRRLVQNAKDALDASGITYRIRTRRLRIYVEADTPAALDVLGRVFGVQSCSRVEGIPWTGLEDVVARGETLYRETVRGRRFAVRARRGGNVRRIPFDSGDVERELGRRLLPDATGVDLGNPEVTVHVEVQPDTAYFYETAVAGHGGLPVGAEGRAVSLVSGGFDSAVASWLLLKRGVRLDYLFLNLGGEAHRRGVLRVMKVIADQWSYGYRPRLFEIDFVPVVAALKAQTTPRYWQILLKRAMLRAGIDLARYLRAPGLVTGEAVGQVSSQTLQNLAVIGAGHDFPILRPLLGFNKEEIIELARTIGTCAFSSEVEEYCAILPRHPSTHAALKPVLAEEAKLDPAFLLDRFRDRRMTDLRELELPGAPGLEVETIPEDATVLDLRSPAAFRAWHYPNAVQVDFFESLRLYGSFDRKPTYVLYCEVGQKSAHLAEVMARDGFRAFHLKHGVRDLLRRAPDRDLLGL